MKHHRTIWIIAGFIALGAALILISRDVRAPSVQNPTRTMSTLAPELSPKQMEVLIQTMKACLDKDPQGRRGNTRSLVDAVASLAESGRYETADTLYALGVKLSAMRDFPSAERAFRKSAEMRPNWTWAYNSLGILLHSSGRTGEAEAMFRKAIDMDPDWSRPHNDLAILLRLTGRLEEAEVEARLALDLEPESVSTQNNYGNLLVALKRFDEAEAVYRKAISLEPDHPAPYYNLACLASLRGDRDEVVPLLLCAIEFDPSYRDEAKYDDDFDPVRGERTFQLLIGG